MSYEAETKKIMQAASWFQPAGSMIAGGALTSVFTGQPINDVDYYFKSKEAFREGVELAYDESLWCVASSDRAVTFARDNSIIQMMLFDFFPDAHSVFDAFDFTACMGAYDLDTKEYVFHDDFLKHASQRFLRFHAGTRFPFGSLLRVLKYQTRGYTIGKGDLLRIALKCHEVPLETWDHLATAIGGQYGEKVSLNQTGEFSIDAAITMIGEEDFTISSKADGDQPGNADALLAKLFGEVAA